MTPYSRQLIDEDDIQSVIDALRSDILTGGKTVEHFESAIAEYVGTKYAVVVNSGTAALHGAYHALGIGEGDEIITTPITFAATANAALYVGAKPVFVDVRYDGNMNETLIEAALTDKTRAIVPVDYAGNPADMDTINAIAKKHGLKVIEDGAHAFGSRLGGRPVGSLADVTTFSFHPVKPLTTLEGGALVTDDPDLAERARRFRSHGMVRKSLWNMDMVDLGYNYRLSDVQCALGLSQMRKLESFIAQRNRIADFYDAHIPQIPGLYTIKVAKENRSSRHLYPVLLDRSLWCSKEDIFKACQEEGLGVQVHYKPVYQHSYYKEHVPTQSLETAEDFYRAELSIPCHQMMTEADAEAVLKKLRVILDRFARGCGI